MARRTRTLVATCLALVGAIGCGQWAAPVAPSSLTGATITGFVNPGSVASPTSLAPLSGFTAATASVGLTVTVLGTNVSAPVDSAGYFQLVNVHSGDVKLLFTASTVNAVVVITNVGRHELIQVQVFVNGETATILNEVRSDGKVELCHRSDSNKYHLIDVSVNAEPAHRAHGDAKVGEPVPADPTLIFSDNCRPVPPGVSLEKSTNGQDADMAPGPAIAVGSAVTWTYVVGNTGTAALTNIAVGDDRIGPVTCPKTTLAVAESMTCTANGVAVAGQYRNVGTVTASSSNGSFTASDPSHYFGVAPTAAEEPKVQLCHRTGNGSYHLIEVSASAEPAHRAHGDGKIGEPVPGSPGRVFGPGCRVI